MAVTQLMTGHLPLGPLFKNRPLDKWYSPEVVATTVGQVPLPVRSTHTRTELSKEHAKPPAPRPVRRSALVPGPNAPLVIRFGRMQADAGAKNKEVQSKSEITGIS
ncbi:hypothetical protein PEBR_05799 [Penicillium brasilianum]|uniref:Uncharacterized protein n=1 Tax=Penicillium brasilianum TaxID=104259 RepID=A0A1S9RX33_PENBI|nr:hypothetical protein PEBR_05799 [Penicillium brasilianum]